MYRRFVILTMLLVAFLAASKAQSGPAILNDSKAEQNLSSTCSKADVEKYGRPIMSARRGGVAYGVSTQKKLFSSTEEIKVYVWLSNESSKDVMGGSCCEYTFLKHIRLFDASGHRLTSTPEFKVQEFQREGRQWVEVCSCSGAIMPYHPGFFGVVDFGTLNRPDTAYRLSPGAYMLIANEANSNSERSEKTSAEPNATGLTVTIVP